MENMKIEENKIGYDRIFEELENKKEKIYEEIDERINELVFIRNSMNIGMKYRKFIEDIVDRYRKIYDEKDIELCSHVYIGLEMSKEGKLRCSMLYIYLDKIDGLRKERKDEVYCDFIPYDINEEIESLFICIEYALDKDCIYFI